MSHLDDLKAEKLRLSKELNECLSIHEMVESLPHNDHGMEEKRLNRKGWAPKNVEGYPSNLKDEIRKRNRLRGAISNIVDQIEIEEKKISTSKTMDHKQRREIMQDRHKQLMQLLDKMDQKRLAAGASSLQIEQERTRRAQISREIQSMINDNDAQDRNELDDLLGELRTMATQGLA